MGEVHPGEDLMRKYLIFLLLTGPVSAMEPSFSLFLNEEEQSKFNQEIGHGLLTQTKNQVALKAVMMMDEDRWALWINEHKITPESCPDHIEVVNVGSYSVDLIWHGDHGPQPLHLKLNEAVNLNEDETPPGS
jgi:hypothetical protein